MTWRDVHSNAALSGLKVPLDDGVTPLGVYKFANELQGPAGPTGPAGAGIHLRGPWTANTVYAALDVVTFGGQSWITQATFTSGASFNAANWTLMAAKGADGSGASYVFSTGLTNEAGTVTVDYGSSAGTAAQGNDTRIISAEQVANKGVAGGYASLGSDGKVPSGQLPAGGGSGGGITPFGAAQVLTASGAIDPTKQLVVYNNASTVIAGTLVDGTTDRQRIQLWVKPSSALHTLTCKFLGVSQTVGVNAPNVGYTLTLEWSSDQLTWGPTNFDGGYLAANFAAATTFGAADLVVISSGGSAFEATGAVLAAGIFAQGGLINKAVSFTPVALTDGANIATDATAGNEFTCALAASGHNLINPTGLPAGKIQYLMWEFTGAFTLAGYGNLFDWGAAGVPSFTGSLNIITGRWNGAKIEAKYMGAGF